jgi:hypothetical protein
VFRFPQIDEDASFSIDFQRTLRIPDSDRTYPLPPGLGRFPLQHVEDHTANLPKQTVDRGGVILPIWQAEAMWLNFTSRGPAWDLPFPVAVKIAAGKINAVTGDIWRSGLHQKPQDYVVSPEQPWLDGYAVDKGVIRQFVAMPLGDGYSAEEQLTGEAEWGGIQISVVPLKAHIWKAQRQAWEDERRQDRIGRCSIMALASDDSPMNSRAAMGLAPGGRMHQTIHADPYGLDAWDPDAADRVFVSLVHGKYWKSITGVAAQAQPPSARDYTQAGLPWFDYYGNDHTALPGSQRLAGLDSLAAKHHEQTGHSLPDSEDLDWSEIFFARGGRRPAVPRPVRSQCDLD